MAPAAGSPQAGDDLAAARGRPASSASAALGPLSTAPAAGGAPAGEAPRHGCLLYTSPSPRD
eukprot:4784274-Alexandrium_andersonii.AAC.1